MNRRMNNIRHARLASKALLLSVLSAPAIAADLDVPAQYPTIQAAIDAATNGDRVLVAPGTYVENINYDGKDITIRSTGGSQQTTIDGNRAEVLRNLSCQRIGEVVQVPTKPVDHYDRLAS